MSVSSSSRSSSLSSRPSDNEEQKQPQVPVKRRPGRPRTSETKKYENEQPSKKRKREEEVEEKENLESSSNAKPMSKQLSWPEQIARIKQRNAPSRDSVDSLENAPMPEKSRVPSTTPETTSPLSKTVLVKDQKVIVPNLRVPAHKKAKLATTSQNIREKEVSSKATDSKTLPDQPTTTVLNGLTEKRYCMPKYAYNDELFIKECRVLLVRQKKFKFIAQNCMYF